MTMAPLELLAVPLGPSAAMYIPITSERRRAELRSKAATRSIKIFERHASSPATMLGQAAAVGCIASRRATGRQV